MTPFRLALASLRHSPGRSAVSGTGTAFAVLLIFMQLGFLEATKKTATMVYDKLQFDILITSSEYLDFSRPGAVDRTRLAQARTVPGVEAVRGLSTTQGLWRNPSSRADYRAHAGWLSDPDRQYDAFGGRRAAIAVLAADPAELGEVFTPDVFPDGANRAEIVLGRVGTVLLDRMSKPDFGVQPAMPAGTRAEFNGRLVELGGTFRVGTGFSYTGLLLTNDETFNTTTAWPRHRVSFGLVTLTPEGKQNPAAVVTALKAALPETLGVLVTTRDDIADRERDHWVNKTAVGKLFVSGVVLALLVGAIFVYQMMVADIKSHLPEYATLKAIGYRFGFLFRTVVWQALFLAAAGYAAGLVVALVLYRYTATSQGLPMQMTPRVLGMVLALTVGMCVGSGLVAVRKVRNADPADLF